MKKSIFKEGDKFENLGSLKEFCNNFGACTIKIVNRTDRNIRLKITSNQDVEIKILCTIALSEIFRNTKGFPADFDHYQLIRVTQSNGRKMIRLISEPAFSVDDLLDEPTSFEDLVAF